MYVCVYVYVGRCSIEYHRNTKSPWEGGSWSIIVIFHLHSFAMESLGRQPGLFVFPSPKSAQSGLMYPTPPRGGSLIKYATHAASNTVALCTYRPSFKLFISSRSKTLICLVQGVYELKINSQCSYKAATYYQTKIILNFFFSHEIV